LSFSNLSAPEVLSKGMALVAKHAESKAVAGRAAAGRAPVAERRHPPSDEPQSAGRACSFPFFGDQPRGATGAAPPAISRSITGVST